MTARLCTLAVCVLLAALTARSLSSATPTTPAKPAATRLVARTDCDVPASFTPPLIMNRRFWNMLPFISPQSSAGKGMQQNVAPEPMVRDAAICYYIGDLRATGDDPLAVNADRLVKLEPNPAVPFVVYTHAGRPPYRILDDYKVDVASYRAWKQAHPNFLGFWAGVEWDNEYLRTLNDLPGAAEAARKHGCSETAVSRMQAFAPAAAASRDGAVKGLRECFNGLRRYYFDDPEKMIFLRGGWCFDQYATQWGAGMPISETTNTGLYRHQVSLYSVRGAARQAGRPWQWYIATYYNGYSKDGSATVNNEPNYVSSNRFVPGVCGENSGPGFGMSVSLSRRDKYLAYLGGASLVMHEDWGRTYATRVEGKPDWVLSPHGEAMKEWYDFTQRHPERGVSYAPVALLLPFNQGMPQWGGPPWSHFNVERPDTMIDAFMYTIAPHTQDTKAGQEGCLANSEFGDLYDIIVPDTPNGPISLPALQNYKVAVLLGKYDMNAPLAARLMEYVRGGGTLVLNARQIGQAFPASFLGAEPSGKTAEVAGPVTSLSGERATLSGPHDYEPVQLRGAQTLWRDSKGDILATLNRVGRGTVVLTTIDHMLPRENLSLMGKAVTMPLVQLLMRQVVREVVPMDIEGDIEYGFCRVPDGWWVYLINNRGVTKWTDTPEELDPAATARVTVKLRDLRPLEVRELRQERLIPLASGSKAFTVEVGPGDVRVVHVKTSR